MVKQNIVPVDIRREIYDKISNIAKEKDTSIRKYVNELLLLNLERDEFLKSYAPFLSKVGVEGNRLTIRDEKTKSYHDVYLHDSKLICESDGSDSCIHVRFALALPELGMLNIKPTQNNNNNDTITLIHTKDNKIILNDSDNGTVLVEIDKNKKLQCYDSKDTHDNKYVRYCLKNKDLWPFLKKQGVILVTPRTKDKDQTL